MNKLTEKIFDTIPYGCFTANEIEQLLGGSPDRRYGLVKRAIAGGEIIPIRRGLYCLTPKYRKKSLNIYSLAQYIYGPSYISFESALSWHGWIPEAVYTVASATDKSKEVMTAMGNFSYISVPQEVLYLAVERHTDDTGNAFFMASPLKALADYVYVNKKDWTSLYEPVENLRIEPEDINGIKASDIEKLIENYQSLRVKRFLKGILKEIE